MNQSNVILIISLLVGFTSSMDRDQAEGRELRIHSLSGEELKRLVARDAEGLAVMKAGLDEEIRRINYDLKYGQLSLAENPGMKEAISLVYSGTGLEKYVDGLWEDNKAPYGSIHGAQAIYQGWAIAECHFQDAHEPRSTKEKYGAFLRADSSDIFLRICPSDRAPDSFGYSFSMLTSPYSYLRLELPDLYAIPLLHALELAGIIPDPAKIKATRTIVTYYQGILENTEAAVKLFYEHLLEYFRPKLHTIQAEEQSAAMQRIRELRL